MILSFGYTSPALLAGAKTVTRRQWKPSHAEQFIARIGQVVDAYDRSTRQGGRKVAEVRIRSVDVEPISAMPDSDYEAEGFAYLAANAFVPPASAPFATFSRESFDAWRRSGALLWVVRFEFVGVRYAHGKADVLWQPACCPACGTARVWERPIDGGLDAVCRLCGHGGSHDGCCDSGLPCAQTRAWNLIPEGLTR